MTTQSVHRLVPVLVMMRRHFQNLQGILQLQMQAVQSGSPLSDQNKIYNTLAQMVNTIGKDAVEDYFNNPEQPEQVVTAERDMLKGMVQQLEGQMQNPLAEAEQVKAEGQMQIKLMEQKYDAQIKMMEMQNAQNEKIADMQAQFDKQLGELKYKYTELATDTRFNYDKLEVENSTDIKGEGTE